MKLKLGIYWDNETDPNPYCPICKTPLQTGERAFIYGDANYGSYKVTCLKCDITFPIKDDGNTPVPLKEAKKRVLTSQKFFT